MTAVGRIVALAVAVAAGSPAYALAESRGRTERTAYTTPGGVTGVTSGDTVVQNDHYGAALVATRRGDRTIGVEILDATGSPVAAEVAQDADGDGVVDTTLGYACGRTTAPLRLKRPGAPVVVYILAGSCGAGVSAPTTGTVVARLS